MARRTTMVVLVFSAACPNSILADDAGPRDADAGAPIETLATSSSAIDRARLRREVEDLEALARGHPPEHLPLPALFETDLVDDAAVARRIEVLSARVGETTSSSASLELERDRLRLLFLRRPRSERTSLLEADRAKRRLADEHERAEKERASAEAAERASELERQKALEAARLAEGEAKRSLAAERARVAAERSAIASLRKGRAEERQRELSVESKRRAEVDEIVARAGQPELSAEAADRTYDDLVALLSRMRDELRRRLDRMAGGQDARSKFRPSIDLRAPEYASVDAERDELVAEISALDDETTKLELDARETNLDAAVALVSELTSLNDRRIALLEKLSPRKRDDVLGLTRAGWAQLERELQHVELMAEWYPRAHARALEHVPALLEDAFTLGRFGFELIAGLVLIAALLIVGRRRKAWTDRIRALVLSIVRRRAVRLWLDGWISALSAVVQPAAFLAAAHLFFDRTISTRDGTELGAVRDVVFAFAWYRLAIAVVHHAITSAASRGRGGVSQEISDKILRSIRVSGRFVLAVACYLIIASAILGKGYLYRLVVGFAWVGAIPIAYVLLRWWRDDITGAYLRAHPAGGLAGAVERTRDRSAGIFVAGAAFAFVAASGATAYVRQTLLGFEQTRKALAFLFRRRLERRQEALDTVGDDAHPLPEALVRMFGEGSVDPQCAVARYPRLEEIAKSLAAYRRNAQGGAAIAVVGEQGAGKTSWLEALVRHVGNGIAIHDLDGRVTSPAEVCSKLCAVLSVDRVDQSEDLIACLRRGPRQVVILDGCQSFVLRAVGGMDGYRSFAEIIARTSDHLFWVCAFARRPFELIRRVEVGRDVFHEEIDLGVWTEESIGDLIDQRMQAAGFTASYDDLIVDRLEGTEFSSEVVRTASSFRRLLWDYADGNPRVAIHFWLRSLIPEPGNVVRVRLFAAPPVEELEGLEERTRFVLAALVQHESITADEASKFLRYSVSECRATLAHLAQRGYVSERGGRYRLTTRWYRATLRFLRRKNLLFT